MENWIDLLRGEILQQVDMNGDVSDDELLQKIDQQIEEYAQEHLLTLQQRERMQQQLFNSFRKLDLLQELLEEPGVTEIMVNGCKTIFYEKEGNLYLWDKSFSSKEKLENVIQQIVAFGNKIVNQAEPIADTRLSDGSRVNIVMEPTAIDGPCITIRRFSKEHMSLAGLVDRGALSVEMKLFLELLVQSGYHIFISGDNSIIGLSQMTFRKKRVAKT